ncbi:alpha/beta fold hydrolase [Leifsonia sp. fls2-241-R2A-40a]|uniref:alpha/beta hydrolase family protein n=1 Tax=Leifsonia sp. fls2-241-R2A-40a TaxID=3040290 RepID=UPI00254DBAB8|nr:alpha/beta fold hydrolase [Leifsonia sp. fls2-241-R2A-40a]
MLGAGLLSLLAWWAVRRVGVAYARAVVAPRPGALTRIHSSTDTTVTLEADRRTLHRGQFGLWFGSAGHAVVGPAKAHDRTTGTVTRELLTVSGDLASARRGHWTAHVHPDPASLRRCHREIGLEVAGGTAPAWLIEPSEPGRPAPVWAIHIHGLNTTRVTVLRSVPATDALGIPSLVVSFRGDGEAPDAPGGVSALGQTEWEDVEAAIAYALDHQAQRIVLVGWSLGGAIALQLAERSVHRAAIDRLVLVGPVTDWRAAIRHTAVDQGVAGWAAPLAIRALGDRRMSARAGLPEPIVFDRLDWVRPGRLAVPALVIHSDGDRVVPFSSSVMFAMANPQLVRLVELPPAEHGWEYNVDPAAFNRAIIDFLQAPRDG